MSNIRGVSAPSAYPSNRPSTGRIQPRFTRFAPTYRHHVHVREYRPGKATRFLQFRRLWRKSRRDRRALTYLQVKSIPLPIRHFRALGVPRYGKIRGRHARIDASVFSYLLLITVTWVTRRCPASLDRMAAELNWTIRGSVRHPTRGCIGASRAQNSIRRILRKREVLLRRRTSSGFREKTRATPCCSLARAHPDAIAIATWNVRAYTCLCTCLPAPSPEIAFVESIWRCARENFYTKIIRIDLQIRSLCPCQCCVCAKRRNIVSSSMWRGDG